MAKLIGDNLTSEIHRGGCTNIEWQIDRSGTPTYETLMPAGADGGFVEEEVAKEGLNGKRHVLYYQQTLSIRYYQTDPETMADMWGSALTTAIGTTGISTKISLQTGDTLTIVMYFSRRFVAEGYHSAAYVELIGKSTSSSPYVA